MKLSYKIFVFLCCIAGVLAQSPKLDDLLEKQKREQEIRRAMRTCIFEHKVTYLVAIQYGKGDFSDTSDNAKCFLKCFAVKLNLFDEATGNPQKEPLLGYSSYLSSENLPFGEIIDKCDSSTERSEDQCDFVFRMYTCLWNEIKNSPVPDNLRNSFNDVFGFNQMYDEGEIKAEIEAEVREKVKQALKEKQIAKEVKTAEIKTEIEKIVREKVSAALNERKIIRQGETAEVMK